MSPLSIIDPNVQVPKPTGDGAKASAHAGKKRKSDNTADAAEHPDLDDIVIPEGTVIEWNANQLRNKIRNFINSAFAFFKKRELAGLPMPTKKKARTSSTESKTTGQKGADKKKDQDKYNVAGIHLDGEDQAEVPIFDTCGDIRTKINKHLRETPATQAGFIRTLREQFPQTHQPEKGLSPASLKTFLSKRGSAALADSPIFYVAYVYFEKLRVKNNKKKTKKREEMEEIWGSKGGMSRVNGDGPFICRADERPWTDKYGQLYFGDQICH